MKTQQITMDMRETGSEYFCDGCKTRKRFENCNDRQPSYVQMENWPKCKKHQWRKAEVR